MLEIIQAGQAGKTHLLFEMHRFRTRIFRDRLGWDVDVSPDGLEVDDFDLPNAVYLLALDDDAHVVGTWRMLPSDGPTMVRDVWPEFLEDVSIPQRRDVWELSRFAVAPRTNDPRAHVAQSKAIVASMFCGVTELCLRAGIREVFTFYDQRIERIVRGLDCDPYCASPKRKVQDFEARVGLYRTDRAMLQRLQRANGIKRELLSANFELPPALRTLAAHVEDFVPA